LPARSNCSPSSLDIATTFAPPCTLVGETSRACPGQVAPPAVVPVIVRSTVLQSTSRSAAHFWPEVVRGPGQPTGTLPPGRPFTFRIEHDIHACARPVDCHNLDGYVDLAERIAFYSWQVNVEKLLMAVKSLGVQNWFQNWLFLQSSLRTQRTANDVNTG